MSAVELKLRDYIEFAKMCAPEYNTPELSDRILVFDVMRNGFETASILETVSKTKSDQTATSTAILDSSSESQRGTGEEGTLYEVKLDTGSQSVDESNGPQNNQPVRQHKIYVHSFWLAVQSSYFRSLFYSSGMKENHDKEVHVKVSESEENAHLTLLEAMYRIDVLNYKTVHELLAVLELANKYDLKFVFKKCKYLVQDSATTLEICTQIMYMIKVKHDMSNVEDLATTLQLVLLKEFSPLDENWQSEKFINLSEPSLKYLLSSDDLIVQSENTVFHALMYWMEQNKIDPAALEEKNSLLGVVRFKLVTIDYLYNVINNHSIASKMPKFNELCLSGVMYHVVPSDQKKLLKKQPLLRKKHERNIIQYTFVVKQKDVAEVARRSRWSWWAWSKPFVKGKLLAKFWACGYEIGIALILNFNNSRVYPHLSILNLNEESLVRLKFAFLGQTDSNIAWQEDSFTLNSCHKIYRDMSFNSAEVFPSEEKMLYVVVAPL